MNASAGAHGLHGVPLEQAYNPAHSKMCFTMKLYLCFSVLLDNISSLFTVTSQSVNSGAVAGSCSQAHQRLFTWSLWFVLLCTPTFRLCQSSLMTGMWGCQLFIYVKCLEALTQEHHRNWAGIVVGAFIQVVWCTVDAACLCVLQSHVYPDDAFVFPIWHILL